MSEILSFPDVKLDLCLHQKVTFSSSAPKAVNNPWLNKSSQVMLLTYLRKMNFEPTRLTKEYFCGSNLISKFEYRRCSYNTSWRKTVLDCTFWYNICNMKLRLHLRQIPLLGSPTSKTFLTSYKHLLLILQM